MFLFSPVFCVWFVVEFTFFSTVLPLSDFGVLFIDGGKVIFDGKTKDFFLSENIRIKEFLDKIKK